MSEDSETHPPDGIRVRPLPGIGEVSTGDDLAAAIAHASDTSRIRITDGDIVVVASKVVSKAEGRVRRGIDRDTAIDEETVRMVARRGPTRIVQTRHGFVMAAAGVDESNVDPGSLVLLPLDPDGSARALRAELARRIGARIGVLITDTFGRPWRLGQTDLAIGAAGVLVLDEYAGQVDDYGNPLLVTAPAVADELASAADLAKPKLAGAPVAVVSGLDRLVTREDGPGVTIQIRSADEDMFRLGTREAVASGAWLARGRARLADEPADTDRIGRLIADVLAANGTNLDRAVWTLTEWRASERARALQVLGLGPSVPYVLGATIRPENRDDTGPILELGAVLDRIALALTAEGFGVRRSSDDELARLAETDGGGDTGTLVALLAVGVPEHDSGAEDTHDAHAPGLGDRTDSQKER